MRARKRLLLKIALLLTSAFGSILLLETAFRAYERAFLIDEVDVSAPAYDLHRYRYNDHHGVITRAKETQEFRILSFGDSFAKAITQPAYTYASLLEKRLGELAPERNVRVVNLGVGSTSFPEYISQYKAWSENVDFDGVIFNIFAGNDFESEPGTVFQAVERNRYEVDGGETPLRFGLGVDIPRKFPLRFLDHLYAHYGSLVHSKDSTDFYKPGLIHIPTQRYLEIQANQSHIYRIESLEGFLDSFHWLHQLLAVAREIEKAGYPVAVTVSPPHFIVSEDLMTSVVAMESIQPRVIDPTLPGAIVREAAKRAGFEGPVFDLTPCLQRAGAEGEELYYGTNTHWNVRGNQLVGEALAVGIAQRWFNAEPADSPAANCAASEPPPSDTVANIVDASFESSQTLSAFEHSTVSPLLGRRFESLGELQSALEDHGLRHDPRAIRGELSSFGPNKVRTASRPQGWAHDLDAVGESVFVSFFHKGRIVGVGRTKRPSRAVAAQLGLREADTPNLLFDSRIRATSQALENDGSLWVVGISTKTRTFASLGISAEALASRGR